MRTKKEVEDIISQVIDAGGDVDYLIVPLGTKDHYEPICPDDVVLVVDKYVPHNMVIVCSAEEVEKAARKAIPLFNDVVKGWKPDAAPLLLDLGSRSTAIYPEWSLESVDQSKEEKHGDE